MDDDLVKRYDNGENGFMYENADGDYILHSDHVAAIERLSAENAALKQEKAVRGTNCVLGSAQCQQLKDAQEALTNAVERIAALESGQPVEVRGEMWQLVPAKLPPEIVNAIHKHPSWPSTVHSFWRITIDALTASAQEAQEDKT